MTRQTIGKEAAVALYESKWWEGKSYRDIAEFQMLTDELCVPFDVFHEALEQVVGRHIWTHELAMNWNGICEELFNSASAPSFQEIMDLIPEEKRVVTIILCK